MSDAMLLGGDHEPSALGLVRAARGLGLTPGDLLGWAAEDGLAYEALLGFLEGGYSSRAREAGLPAFTHTYVPNPTPSPLPATLTLDVGTAAQMPVVELELTIWEPRRRYWRRVSPHMRVSCCRRRRPWRGG